MFTPDYKKVRSNRITVANITDKKSINMETRGCMLLDCYSIAHAVEVQIVEASQI